MSPAEYGLLGGIAGSVIGLLGGLVGTWFSIHNTTNPAERSFVIRAAASAWGVMLLVACAAYLIPSPYKVLAFVPVWLGLPVFIIYWNKKQNSLRD